MNPIGYYNGKIGVLEEMTIPALDRAAYFGDGVYDFIMVKNGVPFGFADHVDRFLNSCRMTRIDLGRTQSELEGELKKLMEVASREADEFSVYWQASRATAFRNHPFPKEAGRANLMAFASPKKVGGFDELFSLHTVEDRRFAFCNVKTINLLLNVLASQEAAENGCQEALFHRGERVTEGSHTSINLIRDGKFITPPLDEYILPSVTRKHLIAICSSLGIPVEERIFTLDEVMNADEVLVASTSLLCRRVDKVDGKPVGGKATDLFRKIVDTYYARYLNETR